MSTATTTQTPAEIPAERIKPGHTMQTVNAFNPDGSFMRQVRYYGTEADARAYVQNLATHR